MSPKVSIIIPVYNSSQYLKKCLDSIIKSEISDFEVLLIDDGSSDNSGSICDEYSKADNRFYVIHQANKGVSAARNRGLDIAKGKWIYFLDSDDFISEDFFYISEEQEDSDIIIKSSVTINQNTDIINKRIVKENKTIKNEKLIKSYSIQKMTNPLWDKIIKHELIGNKRFNESIKIEEDYLFALSIIQNCFSLSFSNIGKYYQIIHDDSAMGRIMKNRDNFIDTKILACEEICKLLKKDKNDNYLKSLLFYRFFPYFASKNIRKLKPNQKQFIDWMLSQYNSSNLDYLTIKQRLLLFLRFLYAKFALL